MDSTVRQGSSRSYEENDASRQIGHQHDTSDRTVAPQPTPSKAFQEEAFRYVSRWCKASCSFLARKIERWKLLEDLYHNRRELHSWGARSGVTAAENRVALRKAAGSRRERWQADIILAPSYIVDTWADKAYQAIFSGPEWLTVVPEDGPERGDARLPFPASFKLQELLVQRLAQGQIHVRLYEILQHLVLFGSVYAKIFWYTRTVNRHRWDFNTLEVIDNQEKIYDCPIIQVIPLDRLLVDWTATHSDVQRHSGIGHRVDKTREHVIDQFRRGVYTLNRDAFMDRWGNAPSWGTTDEERLLRDPDSESVDADEIPKVTVWEWHGLIPTAKGHVESLCTIVTDKGADSPEDGVMVRLTDGPVLWSGLRPFLAAHYTPLPGPFGMGAVESNLDLIHSISQFISQSQDNARLTANAQLIVRRGSSAARQISTESDAVYPGKVWTVDEPGDVQPFPPLHFPQQDVNYLIDYLNNMLERRTAMPDMVEGFVGQAKTATEAHILQESAQKPFTTRADLFARTFLEPLGAIALSMLQQFLLEDQVITVRSGNGREIPLAVTSEEIQSNRFRVAATMTRQDSTRLAKAQSIERVLPTLAQFEPILAREGVKISFSEMIKRYLDLIGVDGVDRVLSRIDAGDAGADLGQAENPFARPGSGQGEGTPAGTAPNHPSRLVENGGPMGPEPTDANALAQALQMQAADALGPGVTSG
ncbi:MAG: hypothetical protein HY914_05230 [Desulfomonile tiedjei]|nr:hypothetical protein [Desulfomonile tiedjei]